MKLSMFNTVESYKKWWGARIEALKRQLKWDKEEYDNFVSAEHPNWDIQLHGTVEEHTLWLNDKIKYDERQLKKALKAYNQY